MLSRVAASLYWMGRYLERAENIARLLDVNIQLLIDFGSIDDQGVKEHWVPVLRSVGDEEVFFQHYAKADSASVTEFMTFHRQNPNSVFSCVCAARENARQVRDQISFEMWEVLNEVYLFLQASDAQKVWRDGPGAFYDQVKRYSHLFQGLTDATFSRTEGWDFLQFGKYLERADKTTRILDVKYHILLPRATDVGGAIDTAQWQAVLRSTSALEAYRRFYVTEILPKKVAEFLVLSDSFPRSLRYCLGTRWVGSEQANRAGRTGQSAVRPGWNSGSCAMNWRGCRSTTSSRADCMNFWKWRRPSLGGWPRMSTRLICITLRSIWLRKFDFISRSSSSSRSDHYEKPRSMVWGLVF
jgi:uncharacterized alpha-E superfamily protein